MYECVTVLMPDGTHEGLGTTDLFGGCTYPFSDTHMREWSYGRIHDMREMQDCRKRIVQLSKIYNYGKEKRG